MKRILAVAGVLFAGTVTAFTAPKDRTPPRAPRYISLLIGVGNYQHVNTATWRELNLKNLDAPGNDVLVMKRVLRNWQFPSGSDNQRVLVDGQATKERIRQAFEWVASRATDSSDVVVIYYSGHGSWAPDEAIDNTRRLDEARTTPGDNYDEGWIPWDARDPNNPRHLVLDDEIGAWLGKLHTANVTMIVDACFSGTITRGGPDERSPSAPTVKGRSAPPSAPGYSPLGAASGLLEGERRMNHTLLTAAASYQLALEKTFFTPTAIRSGVFTRALVEAIDGAGPNTRFDELMQNVRAGVSVSVGESQTPQLEGDQSARLFKVGADVVVPARGYALVVPAPPRHVGIDVGAIHGARIGELYDVYGAGETSFSGRPLAQVRVDSVFEASSFARILPQAQAIPASARAVLSRVPRGAMALDRLRLFVHPSASALRDSLRGFEWLQLTEGPAMAELRRRGNAYQVFVGGYELPPLSSDSADGHTVALAGSVRGAYKGSAGALCEPLRRAYSISAMNLARNDKPPPLSRLKLDVRVLRAGVDPSVRRESVVDTVRLGDPFQIWVRVDIPEATIPHSPLYLSLALAGYTDTPAVLWPRKRGPLPRLTPQQINQWVPVLNRAAAATPPSGIEHVKAVVSSDPFDLRQLVDGLPICTTARNGERSSRGPTPDMVVTGWTAFHRRVVIIPR